MTQTQRLCNTNIPNGNFHGYIVAEKLIITDREYFRVRLAFMANSALIEAWQRQCKDTNMNGLFISQNELAKRWQISQTTLERWRAQRIGPSFLKLGGQVRYRLMDITAFEDQTLQVMPLQKPDVDSQNRRCTNSPAQASHEAHRER